MMYPLIKNEIGRSYGALTVTGFSHSKPGAAFWTCKCKCGTVVAVRGNSLRSGNTTSCGCSQIKHGMTGTKTYKSWTGLMHRCYYPEDISYINYGGRGIKVCKRWHDFSAFFADMGERPTGCSIDRVHGDKGYSKSNCVWSTRKTQNRNHRGNRQITYLGRTQCLSAWCEELGLKYPRMYFRIIVRKWSPEKAFTDPFYARGNPPTLNGRRAKRKT